MPQLTMEYSDNLEVDVKAVFARLHDELVATGAVNMKGLKSRAIRQTEYYIADGYEGYKFIHLDMLLKEGRSIEMQQEISQRAMKVLEEEFGSYYKDDYISLSVNLREMRDGVSMTKHNFPVDGIKSV